MSNFDTDEAPWTAEQVDNLNRFQRCESLHPFTCPNAHAGDRNLVATRNGWICTQCDYTQDWAHGVMLNFSAETLRERDDLMKMLAAGQKPKGD